MFALSHRHFLEEGRINTRQSVKAYPSWRARIYRSHCPGIPDIRKGVPEPIEVVREVGWPPFTLDYGRKGGHREEGSTSRRREEHRGYPSRLMAEYDGRALPPLSLPMLALFLSYPNLHEAYYDAGYTWTYTMCFHDFTPIG